MKFEHTQVMNVKNALRGMRNPLESWDKSDSTFWMDGTFELGKNDLTLMTKLIRAGSEHRKFLRQCFISVDIEAPIYYWKEFDTYKIGTTANSESTMHRLKDTEITFDKFEMTDFHTCVEMSTANFWVDLINTLEHLRLAYLETKDKKYWTELIRMLPESWLQKRTLTMSYENVYNMVHQRYNHKLNEWSGKDDPSKPNFIGWARTLPYAKELIFWDLEKDGGEE